MSFKNFIVYFVQIFSLIIHLEQSKRILVSLFIYFRHFFSDQKSFCSFSIIIISITFPNYFKPRFEILKLSCDWFWVKCFIFLQIFFWFIFVKFTLTFMRTNIWRRIFKVFICTCKQCSVSLTYVNFFTWANVFIYAVWFIK